MLCAEISIYPQTAANADQVINRAIQGLSQQNLEYKVGSLSTHIHGSDEQVWSGIKKMFEDAKASGEVNMVVTISNSAH